MKVFAKLLGIAAGTTLTFVAFGCQTQRTELPTDPVLAESATLFNETVRGVLEHRCVHCHHHYALNGGLNFQDRAGVFRGDPKGPFIVPGKPRQSRVWQAIFKPKTHPNVMPGDGWGLTQAKQKAFLKWIETGAYWPEDRSGELKIRDYKVELEDFL